MIKPFLKWAGGKSRLAQFIAQALPSGKRLVEPFAGSCAISLNIPFGQYLTCDSNNDLINLYLSLMNGKGNFIRKCITLFTIDNNTKDRYYEIRAKFNAEKNAESRSAMFVYLNRHGFKGMCRYNASGEFNIPYGKYDKVLFPGEAMKEFIEKFRGKAEF
ncbi:MAG: Dam family site-specific DNA-(adenine-N6)-methyltransferase, partial [Methanomassiliicoccales archaeon]